MKKILIVVLAVVLVFAFATTAFAGSRSYTAKRVWGGSSQELDTSFSDRADEIRFVVSSVTWNGQSGWKIRGYHHGTGSTCSDLESVTGAGTFDSNYSTNPAAYVVTVKTSITSSTYYDYLIFNGTLYM